MNFDAFEKMRVIVIGDTIIDLNTYTEQLKPLDDGTPVYRRLLDPVRGKGEEISHGGAALVVRNLLELGAEVDFITAFGYGAGALAASSFIHPRLYRYGRAASKPQTIKHRFWCGGTKIVQIDTVDNSPLDSRDAGALMLAYAAALSSADAVIVADYRHGMINEIMAKKIIDLAMGETLPVFAASQISQSQSNHHWYKGAILVMNEYEREMAALPEDYTPSVITMGERGSMAIDWVLGVTECDVSAGVKVDAVDCCGAGDAFLAAFALSGDQKFANIWAALSCTLRGANAPTREMYHAFMAKQEAA